MCYSSRSEAVEFDRTLGGGFWKILEKYLDGRPLAATLPTLPLPEPKKFLNRFR
jgi:hypothetical protein